MRLFSKRDKKLARADNDEERVTQLIDLTGASAIIDVGANVGQFVQRMRAAGLGLPIVSFEPGTGAHSKLQKAAASDAGWTVAPRMAISDCSGTTMLNVNNRSDMNSLKPIVEAAVTAFPKAKPLTEEKVFTRRIDEVLHEFSDLRSGPLFLKIDTQGNELEVLRGAAGVLDRIVGIQLEMSIVPLYEGEPSYLILLNKLERMGYALHLLLPGYFSRVLGRQLQFDGVFVRRP